jgi:hypothetical protein
MTHQTPSPEPESSANKEASGDRRLSTCSPFDLYATAALTGLLSNPTIMASLGLQNYMQGKENAVQDQIVGAAFRYAEIAMEYRQKIQGEATDESHNALTKDH